MAVNSAKIVISDDVLQQYKDTCIQWDPVLRQLPHTSRRRRAQILRPRQRNFAASVVSVKSQETRSSLHSSATAFLRLPSISTIAKSKRFTATSLKLSLQSTISTSLWDTTTRLSPRPSESRNYVPRSCSARKGPRPAYRSVRLHRQAKR